MNRLHRTLKTAAILAIAASGAPFGLPFLAVSATATSLTLAVTNYKK